jgi:hypothetical protein
MSAPVSKYNNNKKLGFSNENSEGVISSGGFSRYISSRHLAGIAMHFSGVLH